MKKFFNKFLLIALASTLLWSCEKDETKVVGRAGTAPTLTSSQSAVVLSAAAAADTTPVEIFSWTAADFGFDAGVSYTLQLAKAGTNFVGAKEVNLVGGRSIGYTTSALNQLALISLALPTGSASQIEARVKAELNPFDAVYSNAVALSVTPYTVAINYPSLWVPGDHQGWAPSAADKISSVADNGKYEGFIYIGSGSLNFKFTSSPDWEHTNYGAATSTITGNNVTGTLSTDGGAGNLVVPVAGYYRMNADINALTWEAVKTEWGLIGDAVPVTGWDSDQDLTYDAATDTWSITLDLEGGKAIKFRANDAWTLNFGDNAADSSLEQDGADISVPESGNYTITLDLSTAGVYTYKVQKN